MINWAHPTHFQDTLKRGGTSLGQPRGLRANASCLRYDLGNAEELDIGNPQELGHQHDHVLGDYQHIKFFGVCCGTDHRRLAEIAKAGQEKFKTAA